MHLLEHGDRHDGLAVGVRMHGIGNHREAWVGGPMLTGQPFHWVLHIDVAEPAVCCLVANPGTPGWNGPYLRDGELPQDAWGGDFIYRFDGDQVRVISLGADGQPGGSGQNADIAG